MKIPSGQLLRFRGMYFQESFFLEIGLQLYEALVSISSDGLRSRIETWCLFFGIGNQDFSAQYRHHNSKHFAFHSRLLYFGKAGHSKMRPAPSPAFLLSQNLYILIARTQKLASSFITGKTCLLRRFLHLAFQYAHIMLLGKETMALINGFGNFPNA